MNNTLPGVHPVIKKYCICSKHAITALILTFIVTCSLKAQNQTYRHLTTRDGLSAGYIDHMIQDANGFIWIGTSNGLNRYDGYEMVSYLPDPLNPSAITGARVLMIEELNREQLLIGTTTGLNLMNTLKQEFRFIQLAGNIPQIVYASDIQVMENGDLWVTSRDGLFHLPEQDLTADSLQAKYYQLIEEQSDGPTEFIKNFAYNGNNSFVIGTSRSLYQFQIDDVESGFTEVTPQDSYTAEILQGDIWDVTATSEGTIYISSTTGLAKWDAESSEPEAIKQIGPLDKNALKEASFQSIVEDRDGNLWLGTGLIGAIKWKPGTDNFTEYRYDPDNENSINSQVDDVHFAFTDSQNNVWFGYHYLGISVMYSSEWNYTYSLATSEYEKDHPANVTFDFAEDDEGNLWFPTRDGLVFHPNNADDSIVYKPENVSDSLKDFSIIIKQEDYFLLPTSDGNRLFRFDLQTKEFRDVTPEDSIKLAPFSYVENDSSIFFPTPKNEIVKINKATYELQRIPVPVSFGNSETENPLLMGEDSDGNFLLMALDISDISSLKWETFLFNSEDESFVSVPLDLPQNVTALSLPHVSAYQPGVMWMRLNDSIFRQNLLTGETASLFQSNFGIINEGSGVLYEDPDGYIWKGNQSGMMKLDPLTESIEYFEADNERRPTVFNQPSLLSNGDMLVTGTGGYIRFNPNNINREEPIQHIYITGLESANTFYHPLGSSDASFEFESSENNIKIAFLGINYRTPLYTRYRYKIEGYNEEWVSVGTQRRVFLANLPAGEYNLNVQAAPQFGTFSEHIATANFTILPPWWRTIPAYILYALLFIGAVFTADRFQRRRLLSKERERSREKELEQAREIEQAYENLKAAQEQLVQQEKLASLGQLTAGIAHEIKNPLNFVNNFSELSVELIEEAREELSALSPHLSANGDMKKVDETLSILSDIESNLKKIHEHGSRADSIVKSMLQHSRGGSGSMEPTNLNNLTKEYVNLAFHGMRAGKNPINVDIDLQLEESVGEVPLIAEDFSRVIVNLCNNAFDAMREKTLQGFETLGGLEQYRPKLTVRTQSKGNTITLEIEDNGPGIPDEMKGKILQPFFTTKKGTEGTGLGLSITNDIIKAHGGEMNIKTEEGSGSVFVISLQKNALQ